MLASTFHLIRKPTCLKATFGKSLTDCYKMANKSDQTSKRNRLWPHSEECSTPCILSLFKAKWKKKLLNKICFSTRSESLPNFFIGRITIFVEGCPSKIGSCYIHLQFQSTLMSKCLLVDDLLYKCIHCILIIRKPGYQLRFGIVLNSNLDDEYFMLFII